MSFIHTTHHFSCDSDDLTRRLQLMASPTSPPIMCHNTTAAASSLFNTTMDKSSQELSVFSTATTTTTTTTTTIVAQSPPKIYHMTSNDLMVPSCSSSSPQMMTTTVHLHKRMNTENSSFGISSENVQCATPLVVNPEPVKSCTEVMKSQPLPFTGLSSRIARVNECFNSCYDCTTPTENDSSTDVPSPTETTDCLSPRKRVTFAKDLETVCYFNENRHCVASSSEEKLFYNNLISILLCILSLACLFFFSKYTQNMGS